MKVNVKEIPYGKCPNKGCPINNCLQVQKTNKFWKNGMLCPHWYVLVEGWTLAKETKGPGYCQCKKAKNPPSKWRYGEPIIDLRKGDGGIIEEPQHICGLGKSIIGILRDYNTQKKTNPTFNSFKYLDYEVNPVTNKSQTHQINNIVTDTDSNTVSSVESKVNYLTLDQKRISLENGACPEAITVGQDNTVPGSIVADQEESKEDEYSLLKQNNGFEWDESMEFFGSAVEMESSTFLSALDEEDSFEESDIRPTNGCLRLLELQSLSFVVVSRWKKLKTLSLTLIV